MRVWLGAGGCARCKRNGAPSGLGTRGAYIDKSWNTPAMKEIQHAIVESLVRAL